MSSYSLSNFVEGVSHDLGNPPEYPLFRLSGWFLDNANIGKLNNLIGSSISGVSYQNPSGVTTGYGLEPYISNDQLAIFKMLFDYEYYKNMSRTVAQSAASNSKDWVSLKEGDSSITRINKNELSKNFRGLANDAKKDLDSAVKMYLKNNCSAEQVAGDDTFGRNNYFTVEWNRVNIF